MSRASELEAARLAAERIDNRCEVISAPVRETGMTPEGVTLLERLADQMLAEATYIAEQRKSGWKSRSDAHTAAGRILEQWAKDLAAYLERDKPPMRPPLETVKSPDRHAGLDPADGPISAQITSGLLSQVPVDHASPAWNEGYVDGMGGLRPDRKHDPNYADGWQTGDAEREINGGPVTADVARSGLLSQAIADRLIEQTVTPDVARSIREAKDVDAKLDVAFGRPAPVFAEDVTHITAAPANYAWCDATSGARGYVGTATCPDCIARYDAYDAAANKALALTPPSEFVPILDDPALIERYGAPQFSASGIIAYDDGSVTTVSIPQFSEPGAPPPQQTQQRLTFAQVREHGQARARGVDHRSYSQVQAFKECGVKYALSDLDTPAWWNVGGTALHYACEWLNRETFNMQAKRTDPVYELYDFEVLWTNCLGRATSEAIAEHPTVDTAHWRAAKKGVEGYDWWRINGVDMVRRWVARLTWLYDQGWRVAEFNGTPAIEYDCPMWIGDIKVENIIDLVLTRGDGTLLIVDAKAGASAPDDTAQLGQYAWALDRHVVPPLSVRMQQTRIIGAYWLARTDELRYAGSWQSPGGMLIDLRELHPWDELEYLITTMDAAERQGLYLPNKSKSDRFGCGSCGVRGLCPVGPR